MKSLIVALLAAAALAPAGLWAAEPDKAAVAAAMNAYLPGTSGFKVGVDSIVVDSRRKQATVYCNDAASYLSLDSKASAAMLADVKAALGDDVRGYKVDVRSTGRSMRDLARFASKAPRAPREKQRFVTDLDAPAAPAGMDGANIALWQSHGWYFEPKTNRWQWQRARLFSTVEDLYTQSYVMPFLMPMLRNAGAYVMSPRERDINLTEIIVDGDGGKAYPGYADDTAAWSDAGVAGFGYTKARLRDLDNPFRAGAARVARTVKRADRATEATWSADIPAQGEYAVYVSYPDLPDATADARYTVHTAGGDRTFTVNQTMGAGTWIYLGHFELPKGKNKVVTLSTLGSKAGKAVSADAVKIGGGMGNVERIIKDGEPGVGYEYAASGYPRFVEGARYFLQWAGAPDSVYTPSGNVNDYGDDYRSRGLWVNWLAGGSSMLPKRDGLGIPVDLSFAFHSDAGTTPDDSIIGTLGIYCTNGDVLGNGSSRMASRDLTDLVLSNIVDDVRAQFEPEWTRRGMWDKSYYEARVPEVPAMLLELLSHQNFADMKYGLDPEFRFTVSRAIYKGMLQFLARRDGREYVVQPLAPRAFAIRKGAGEDYELTWKPTPDSLEASAMPTYYLVQEAVNDHGFRTIARVTELAYTFKATDEAIHSFRIIAGNDGGVSFASETLSLRSNGTDDAPVVIVNGFTRVSAPDWFESGEVAGFNDGLDHGVPYMYDISFIGDQFEFRRSLPWTSDDACGFGGSRANYEDRVVAGNTFDYVYDHGCAVSAAGLGFVSESVEAFCESAVQEGAIVDLILGKQKETAVGRGVYGTRYKTFPAALQAKLRAHTAAGGDVLVSGAYVATDLWQNPFSSAAVAEADQAFAADVLGYKWRVGQATVEGAAHEVKSRFKAFDGGTFEFSTVLNEDCYAVESPDSFFPSDSKRGATIMRYDENGLAAGTAFDAGSYRTVVLGFPFETITDAASRDALMKQVINFFTK